jgi:hypothetical protein
MLFSSEPSVGGRGGPRLGSRRGLKLAEQEDKNELVEHLKSHYLRDHFRSS